MITENSEVKEWIDGYKEVVDFISNEMGAKQEYLESALEILESELLKIMPKEEVEQVLDQLHEES